MGIDIMSDKKEFVEGFTKKTVSEDGSVVYTKVINGRLTIHRDDGPAVIHKNGEKYWYNNGNLHRECGPAVITAAMHKYYINDRLTRFDGPAIEVLSYNTYINTWMINGKDVNASQYKQWLTNNGMDMHRLTKDDKLFILLLWG